MAKINLGKVGMRPRDDWSSFINDYEYLDTVRYEGEGYLVKIKEGFVPAGKLPTDGLYYMKLVDKGLGGSKNVRDKIYGKKISILGDSISTDSGGGNANLVFPEQYWGQLQVHQECQISNNSISGSTVSSLQFSMTDPAKWQSVNSLFEPDVIFIFGGINDFLLDVPLGTSTDTVVTTFYGALDYLYKALMGRCPGARIFHITPLHTNHSLADGTIPEFNGISFLSEYVDAIDIVAKRYGVGVINAFQNSGITCYNIATLSNDDLHIDPIGHKMIYETIISETNLKLTYEATEVIVQRTLTVNVSGASAPYEVYINNVLNAGNSAEFPEGTLINSIRVVKMGYTFVEQTNVTMNVDRVLTFPATPVVNQHTLTVNISGASAPYEVYINNILISGNSQSFVEGEVILSVRVVKTGFTFVEQTDIIMDIDKVLTFEATPVVKYLQGFTPIEISKYVGDPDFTIIDDVYSTTLEPLGQTGRLEGYTIGVGSEIAVKLITGNNGGFGFTNIEGFNHATNIDSSHYRFSGGFTSDEGTRIYGITFNQDWGQDYDPFPNRDNWLILRLTSESLVEIFETPDGIELTRVAQYVPNVSSITHLKFAFYTLAYPQGKNLIPIA